MTRAILLTLFRSVEAVVRDDVPEWNDAPERTQAEVVAKLREAAKLAEQQP